MSNTEISLLFDEHMPSSAAQELRNRGLDVEAVYETELQSASDKTIAEHAEETGKVIVTQDSDFLNLKDKIGLIFLTEPLEIGELTREILQVVQKLQKKEFENSTIYIPW